MFIKIFYLVTMFSMARTHICIIYPHQRGVMNITEAGDHSCTRHGYPCGGQSPGPPTATFRGGDTTFIKYQQNLNHYEIGYPGYMDIALSRSQNSTRFEILATIGDKNEHAQWHQQNYTIPVVLPAINCTRCVLRMRYVSNKPGEEIFYQCSDINITVNSALSGRPDKLLPPNLRRVQEYISRTNQIAATKNASMGPTQLFGFSWNILESPGSDLVSVDSVSGQITTQSYQRFYFNMGVGVQYGTPSPMAESYKFLIDQIACYSREIPYIFMLEHRNGNITAKPNKIIWIYLDARSIADEYEIKQPSSGHFVALSPFQRTNFLALLLNKEMTVSYNLTFATLDYMGNFQDRLNISIGKEFVNFLWATPDLTKQLHYVIMGDENSPRELKTVLWTYNITNNTISSFVHVDVSRYTISAIQVYEKTGQLFAVSPGLFGQERPAWSLVKVDPATGSISHVMDLAKSGLFDDYYGGTVFNLDQARGLIYHVFRVSGSVADVIATIDLESKAVTFSQLTNLRHVYNLANPYFPVQSEHTNYYSIDDN